MAATLDLATIARTRLANQHVGGPGLATVTDVVRSLGAVQAQDYGHSLWALGLRTRDTTVDGVEAALGRGEIVRTWAMRGTLHYAPAQDVRWMLDLLAMRVVARLTPKVWRFHGTDDAVMDLARETLVEALRGDRCVPRRTLVELLASVGIPDDKQQTYFIFGYLSQTGVLCPGAPDGKLQTFALLDEWAPRQRRLGYEESIAVLAGRFFGSHGPATVADFANWSGLKITEARAGWEAVRGDLVREAVGDREFWLAPGSTPGSGTHLVPAYDELLIGYADRAAAFQRYGTIPISTYNGMFHATLVEDGQVAGRWKRALKRTRVDVELRPADGFDTATVAPHAAEYGRFLGLPVRTAVAGPVPRTAAPAPAHWSRAKRA